MTIDFESAEAIAKIAELKEEAGNPTIGRTVHYHSYGTPGGEYKPAPRAALTTTDPNVVWSSDKGWHLVIGLCVLNPTGMFFNLDVPFSPTPKPGHWSWPPRI